MFLTGCRLSEARALKVKDLNFNQNTITISRTFSRNELREKRKGINSPPVTLPIHPELRGTLEYYIQNKLSDVFVFINPNTGRPYHRRTIERLWQYVRKTLNLPQSLRLYDATRHSFASQLLNVGVSIAKISKLLGHTNIHTTEKYAHVNLKDLQVDITKIALFKSIKLDKSKQIKLPLIGFQGLISN